MKIIKQHKLQSAICSPAFWFLSPSGLHLYLLLFSTLLSDHAADLPVLSCSTSKISNHESPWASHLPTSLPPVPMLDCLCIPSVNFSPLIFPSSVHLIHELICLFPPVRGHGQQISGLSGLIHPLTSRLPLTHLQPLLNCTVFFRFLLVVCATHKKPRLLRSITLDAFQLPRSPCSLVIFLICSHWNKSMYAKGLALSPKHSKSPTCLLPSPLPLTPYHIRVPKPFLILSHLWLPQA